MPRLSVDISLGQHRALKWAAMQEGRTVTEVTRAFLDRLPVPPPGAPIDGQESRSTVDPFRVPLPQPTGPATAKESSLSRLDAIAETCPHPERVTLGHGVYCTVCKLKLR